MNHLSSVEKKLRNFLSKHKVIISSSKSYSIIVQRDNGIYSASIRELCLSHSSTNLVDVLVKVEAKELEAISALTTRGETLPPRLEALERKSRIHKYAADFLSFSVKSLLVMTIILVAGYSFALNKFPTVISTAKERLVQYIDSPSGRQGIHQILNSLDIKICVERQ